MIDTTTSGNSLTKEKISYPTGIATRLWEVDALRGIAIVLMVFYHFMWDLNFFDVYQTHILGTAWQSFARSIATMFIFTLGLSLTLSYNREVQQSGSGNPFRKYFLRGVKIFGWGLVITAATYFFIGPRGFVIFGILHLLGFSVVAGYLFLKLNKWITLAAGVAVIAAGLYVDSLVSASPWFIWLGIKQLGRSMVDYYPALPWFGISLVGIFVGYSLYPHRTRRFALPDWSAVAPVRGLRFLGRHSLLIYLVHQPIIIGLFFALGYGP